MSGRSGQEGVTFRYTQAFRCLGSDCPDNCCKHWEINVDKNTYKKWQKILPQDELDKKVLKHGKGSLPGIIGKIKLEEDGHCPFLNKDSLCEIHKDHGESSLPYPCRTYPKGIMSVIGQYELSMTLSCPEVARLALLDSTAMELVNFDPSDLVNSGSTSMPRKSKESPAYFKSLNPVRDTLLYILGMREITIQQRIFIATWFAETISNSINHKMSKFDEHELVRQLDRLSAPGVLLELCAQFEKIPEACEFGLLIIQTILFQRIHKRDITGDLIGEIVSSYGFKSSHYKEGELFKVVLEPVQGTLNERFASIASIYLSRRNRLRKKYGDRIDLYFENYCRHFLFQNLMVDFESPYVQMQHLIVRLSVIKFLFFSHPALDPLFDSNDVREGDLDILDDTAVKVLYKFSRGIEHAFEFLQKVHEELERQDKNRFAHFVLLMKL